MRCKKVQICCLQILNPQLLSKKVTEWPNVSQIWERNVLNARRGKLDYIEGAVQLQACIVV